MAGRIARFMDAGPAPGSVILRTPAKLNLRLKILGLRGDGYHEIITWMQQISLYDEMRVEPRERRIRVYADCGDAPDGEENIAHRAASALREASGRAELGARIHLKKNIPVGAGLGGGSGNAAGALWALNRLWGLRMPKAELSGIAARIGSDAPFFLHGPAAVCRGRGERVEKKEALRSGWFLLVRPPVKLSTREVYAWSREKLRREKRNSGEKNAPARLGRYEYGNDLEEVVFPRVPMLERLRGGLLRLGARRAMMSGSGSTVFGAFRRKGEAERAAAAIGRDEGCECFVVRPLRESVFGQSERRWGGKSGENT